MKGERYREILEDNPCNSTHLFLSNRLERIFDSLRSTLFRPGDPWCYPRRIVVPSPAVRQWLEFQCARELGISTGWIALYLHQVVEGMPMDGTASLLWIIDQLLASLRDSDELDAPLIAYLDGHPQRMYPLAEQLAQLFQNYTLYGVNIQVDPWQMRLWQNWVCAFSSFPRRSVEGPLHFFGYSFLPPRLFHQFADQGAFFYFLSPCQEFWSELYQESRIGENAQPLLVSLGRVGSLMARQFEESWVPSNEDYEVKQNTPTQQTLLELIPCQSDPTIELHGAPTKLREVEILQEALTRLGVAFADIQIFSPHIEEYAPALKAVFGTALHFQGGDPSRESGEVSLLMDLLLIEEERWSRPALRSLYAHPSCRLRWNQEEIRRIEEWADQTGIRWGYDQRYRQSWIAASSGQGSWKGGIQQLWEQLALDNDGIDFPEVELLEQWEQWIDALYSALTPLREGEAYSARTWANYFLEWMARFFDLSLEKIVEFLEPLHQCHGDNPIPFETLHALLSSRSSQQDGFPRFRDRQKIRCDTYLPGRVTPSKVICVLGLNHETFPRCHQNSLDGLLHHTQVPSIGDLDRGLFLDTLLSYREKLFLFYQSVDPTDGSLKRPSSVVELLLPHISHHHHPFYGYDRQYFLQKLPYGRSVDYALLQAKERTCPAPSLFSQPSQQIEMQGSFHHTIHDFLRLVRYPLQYYFHQLSFPHRPLHLERDPLGCSPWAMGKLRSLVLNTPMEQAIQKLQKRGELPEGPLWDALRRDEEWPPMEGSATYYLEEGVVCQDEVATGIFHLPAIKLTADPWNASLTGELRGILDRTLYVPDGGDLRGVVRWWIYILLAHHLGLIDQCYFIKTHTVFPLFHTDTSRQLQRWLAYACRSRAQPSPLYPEIVVALLKGSQWEEPYDPAWKWALQTHQLGNEVFSWAPVARELYAEVYDAWF